MPRTRRTISIDEKIAQAEADVEKQTERLAKAKENLEMLKKKKDDKRKQEVMDAIDESGKSIDEILEFLHSGTSAK